MMHPNLDRLLSSLQSVRRTGEHQWEARCPCHDDNRASLSIGALTPKLITMHCHAGCETKDVLNHLGMGWKDLFPPPNKQARNSQPGKIVAEYDYHDAEGELIFQAVRLEPKDFRQRRPDGNGGWKWSVKGCKVVPYRLPQLLKANHEETVYVVEGEKDVDRLIALGLVATCNAGGAGKWKTSHSNHLKGRDVVIIQDNDSSGKKHAQKVAESVYGKAASIKILELPDLIEKGDVSDWLDAGGTVEKLKAIVKATLEWDASESRDDASEEEQRLQDSIVKKVASVICGDPEEWVYFPDKKKEGDEQSPTPIPVKCLGETFAKGVAGKLYRFKGGCYHSRGEDYIRRLVKHVLDIMVDQSAKWSSNLAAEVVEWIRLDALELWERPPADIVNVKNGLLRLADGKLVDHTPDHLSQIQLPVTYDPSATCPAYDQFVSEVFPPDATHLAYEVPAWAMVGDTSIQKAVLLLGPGGNGKSVWLSALKAYLGSVNVSALSLHRLESNRFSSARLVGKVANICPDLPTEDLEGTSTFKAITGGDAIEGEHKHRDSFMFEPFCKLIFSANSPPRSQDASEGFFDRWLVIPFDARFRGTTREISRAELDARLSSPSELSGILNKAMLAWRRIKQAGRLSEPESIRQAFLEFHASTDPLAVWLDQNTTDDPDAVVTKQALRTAYGVACEKAGRPTPTAKSFGLALRRSRSNVSDCQKKINGKVQWCYQGIGLLGECSQRSLRSLYNPYLNPIAREKVSSKEQVDGSVEQGRGNTVNAVNGVNHEDAPQPHQSSSDREVLSL